MDDDAAKKVWETSLQMAAFGHEMDDEAAKKAASERRELDDEAAKKACETSLQMAAFGVALIRPPPRSAS